MPTYVTKKASYRIGETVLVNNNPTETLIFLPQDRNVEMLKKEPLWSPILASEFVEFTAADEKTTIKIPYTPSCHIVTVGVLRNNVPNAPVGRVLVYVNDEKTTPVNVIEGYPWIVNLSEHFIDSLIIKCVVPCKVLVDAEQRTPEYS